MVACKTGSKRFSFKSDNFIIFLFPKRGMLSLYFQVCAASENVQRTRRLCSLFQPLEGLRRQISEPLVFPLAEQLLTDASGPWVTVASIHHLISPCYPRVKDRLSAARHRITDSCRKVNPFDSETDADRLGCVFQSEKKWATTFWLFTSRRWYAACCMRWITRRVLEVLITWPWIPELWLFVTLPIYVTFYDADAIISNNYQPYV